MIEAFVSKTCIGGNFLQDADNRVMRYIKISFLMLCAGILAEVLQYIYPQKIRGQKETASQNGYRNQILQKKSDASLPEAYLSSNASRGLTQPTGNRPRSTPAKASQSVKKEAFSKKKENILTKSYMQDLSAYIKEQFYPLSRYVDEFLNKLQQKSGAREYEFFWIKTEILKRGSCNPRIYEKKFIKQYIFTGCSLGLQCFGI